MMKWCKYINNREVKWFRNPLRENGRVYSNPPEEMLQKWGYMPLIDSERGAECAGYVQIPHYSLNGINVVRSWIYEPNEFIL